MLDKNSPVSGVGLKSCDGSRKALKALAAAGYAAELRDLRQAPLTDWELRAALDAFGSALVNTRSPTWRGLDEAARAAPPETLLAAHPALMKRPLIVQGGSMYLGLPKQL